MFISTYKNNYKIINMKVQENIYMNILLINECSYESSLKYSYEHSLKLLYECSREGKKEECSKIMLK